MLRVDWNLLLTIINLLLLFVMMRIFLFKPVQKIIAARQAEADRQFKEADESKQAAEEARKQYEASLANAEETKKQVLQEARQTADAEYKRIVSDAEKIGSMCDGAILVIRSGEISKSEVKSSIKQLERSECKILGVVLNRATDAKGKKNKKKYYNGK